jgi:ABC-2 type transport system ATP-binding protein
MIASAIETMIPETLHVTSPNDAFLSATAISVQGISKTYPVSLLRLKRILRRRIAEPVEALRNVSFDVRQGEVFGLIGRNGAGKTTLAKIIATLVRPTAGSVAVEGYDSIKDEEQVRASIGLATAEERSFYWRLTATENLTFFARLYGLAERAAPIRIRELLEQFELTSVARRRFGELSTGNKQRMAVARAMLACPPVLLLDEPTRSLDPVAAARMRTLIAELAGGRNGERRTTILLTSHNLSEIEELCPRVGIITRGQIRAVDTPEKLRRTHPQHEQVRLEVSGIDEKHFSRLKAEIPDVDFRLEEKSTVNGRIKIMFTRQASDEKLDSVLRLLHRYGARIVSCDTERATLLDVLEAYEKE